MILSIYVYMYTKEVMSVLAVIADCEKHITVTDFNFQKK